MGKKKANTRNKTRANNAKKKSNHNKAAKSSHSNGHGKAAVTSAAPKVAVVSPTPQASDLPLGLASSLSILTPSQQKLAKQLCTLPGSTNQRHLFDKWSSDDNGKDDGKKKALLAKLESVDQSYPDGGLTGYLSNAIALLEKSRRGENPLEGWIPSVPKGEAFEVGTDAFLATEELGLKEVGKCGFVLVAGGLGERLGYGDIKVS